MSTGPSVPHDHDEIDDGAEELTPAEELALQAAWQNAFRLEDWIFIARGVGDQVTPLAFETPEGGVIAVFTSKELALEFGLAIGLPEEEAGFQLAIPRPSCVEWLLQFVDDGVSAAVLDPGTTDAAVMLAALPHVEQLALAAADDAPVADAAAEES